MAALTEVLPVPADVQAHGPVPEYAKGLENRIADATTVLIPVCGLNVALVSRQANSSKQIALL